MGRHFGTVSSSSDEEDLNGRAVLLPTQNKGKCLPKQKKMQKSSMQCSSKYGNKGKLKSLKELGKGKAVEGDDLFIKYKKSGFPSIDGAESDEGAEGHRGTNSRQGNKRPRRECTFPARQSGGVRKRKKRFSALESIGQESEAEGNSEENNEASSFEHGTNGTDIPERLQILDQSLGRLPSSEEWCKEAHWIYDRMLGCLAPSRAEDVRSLVEKNKQDIVDEIHFVLTQLHDHKLEIPFIAMYRYHGCVNLAGECDENFDGNEDRETGLRRYEALWEVFALSKKWHLLQSQKCLLKGQYTRRAALEETESSTRGILLGKVLKALSMAESEHAIDDVDAQFNLYFPSDEAKVLQGQYKRPRRQSHYATCRSAGLGDLSKQFGLTAEQLGENLQALSKVHEVFDCSFAPEDIYAQYCSNHFPDRQCVLAGARHMASTEVSREPIVREYARGVYYKHAFVNTKLTKTGEVEVDDFHQYASVKCLQEKPVANFEGGEWLLVQKAKQEDLLTVCIELDQKIVSGVLIEGILACYLSTESTGVVALWNEQRKEIIQDAIQMLFPVYEKEIHLFLTAKAKMWVQQECKNGLWKRVSVAPYSHPSDVAPRVLACCWGFRNPPTTFIMLDGYGELIDILQTGYLNTNKGNFEQLERKATDEQKLEKFMMEHQPHVVVLGATSTPNSSCRHLKEFLMEVVSRVAQESPGLGPLTVVYGEESVPLLYEKSHVSTVEVPHQSSIVRRGVALARYLQNPLAMVASLCSHTRDIVALNLDPMQRFLTADEIYEAVEEVMVTATNQVGIDVNLAAVHKWLWSPLQFVAGFGTQNGSFIQQMIQVDRPLYDRKDLLKRPFYIKEAIFKNCCGFLCVRDIKSIAMASKRTKPFDDTRIHPESYEIAKNVVVFIWQQRENATNEEVDDSELLAKALGYLKNHLECLSSLDIKDLHTALQDVIEGVRIETLRDIRRELLHGFKDYRSPYIQPTEDEEFTWLTGESDESLAVGRLVNATVRKVFQHWMMCVLESGIWGVLQKEDLPPELAGGDLSQVFAEGNSLMCRIAGVLKDRCLVNLTYGQRVEEEEDFGGGGAPTSFKDAPPMAAKEVHSKQNIKEATFKPRAIVHPLFQNISMSDARKQLSTKEAGELIFHPSGNGPTFLSMTLKIYNDVYVQRDVEEHDKDIKDLKSFMRLGKTLKIGHRLFKSLDEVMTLYACPLMNKLKELVDTKDFKTGRVINLENELLGKDNAYCLSFCEQNSGAIRVSFSKDHNIFHEKVDLCPEGYSCRGKMFRTIDALVNYLRSASEKMCTGFNNESKWKHGGGDGERKYDGGGRRGRGGRFGRDRGFTGLGRGRGRGRGRGFSNDDGGAENCQDSTGWSDKRNDSPSWDTQNGFGMRELGEGGGRGTYRGRRGGRRGTESGSREGWLDRPMHGNGGWCSEQPTSSEAQNKSNGGWGTVCNDLNEPATGNECWGSIDKGDETGKNQAHLESAADGWGVFEEHRGSDSGGWGGIDTTSRDDVQSGKTLSGSRKDDTCDGSRGWPNEGWGAIGEHGETAEKQVHNELTGGSGVSQETAKKQACMELTGGWGVSEKERCGGFGEWADSKNITKGAISSDTKSSGLIKPGTSDTCNRSGGWEKCNSAPNTEGWNEFSQPSNAASKAGGLMRAENGWEASSSKDNEESTGWGTEVGRDNQVEICGRTSTPNTESGIKLSEPSIDTLKEGGLTRAENGWGASSSKDNNESAWGGIQDGSTVFRKDNQVGDGRKTSTNEETKSKKDGWEAPSGNDNQDSTGWQNSAWGGAPNSNNTNNSTGWNENGWGNSTGGQNSNEAGLAYKQRDNAWGVNTNKSCCGWGDESAGDGVFLKNNGSSGWTGDEVGGWGSDKVSFNSQSTSSGVNSLNCEWGKFEGSGRGVGRSGRGSWQQTQDDNKGWWQRSQNDNGDGGRGRGRSGRGWQSSQDDNGGRGWHRSRDDNGERGRGGRGRSGRGRWQQTEDDNGGWGRGRGRSGRGRRQDDNGGGWRQAHDDNGRCGREMGRSGRSHWQQSEDDNGWCGVRDSYAGSTRGWGGSFAAKQGSNENADNASGWGCAFSAREASDNKADGASGWCDDASGLGRAIAAKERSNKDGAGVWDDDTCGWGRALAAKEGSNKDGASGWGDDTCGWGGALAAKEGSNKDGASGWGDDTSGWHGDFSAKGGSNKNVDDASTCGNTKNWSYNTLEDANGSGATKGGAKNAVDDASCWGAMKEGSNNIVDDASGWGATKDQSNSNGDGSDNVARKNMDNATTDGWC